MIQSAMMFALGVCVSALVALVFAIVFVRRTRRVTARRVLASVATRRAEFETERDELRVRHALEMRRIEERSRELFERAAVDRLHADSKIHEVAVLRSDLSDRELEVSRLDSELAELAARRRELETRHMETVSELKAVRMALEAEEQRSDALRATLLELRDRLDERRIEIFNADAEPDSLRAALALLQATPSPQDGAEPTRAHLGGEPSQTAPVDSPAAEVPPSAAIFRLPSRRPRTEEGSVSDQIERVAREVNRIAGEVRTDLLRGVSRAQALLRRPSGTETAAEPGAPATARPEPAPPALQATAPAPAEPAPLFTAVSTTPLRAAAKAKRADDPGHAESRFLEALNDIKALKTGAPAE